MLLTNSLLLKRRYNLETCLLELSKFLKHILPNLKKSKRNVSKVNDYVSWIAVRKENNSSREN